MDVQRNETSPGRMKSTILPEAIIALALSVLVFLISSRYDIVERLAWLSKKYEYLELDEIVSVSVFLIFALLCFSMRRWKEARRSEALALQHGKDLEKALSEIRQLRGIITICSACKKIRNDEGFWQQLELYIEDHSEAEFSHGLCSDCARKLYPELVQDGQIDELP